MGEGRTVSRPREMVPMNLQMVDVVRDILFDGWMLCLRMLGVVAGVDGVWWEAWGRRWDM